MVYLSGLCTMNDLTACSFAMVRPGSIFVNILIINKSGKTHQDKNL